MKRFESIIVLAILIIAFALRTWHINAPIADWHSWRQADTAAVTRNYVQDGLDLLHPKFDDISSIPSGLENPEGYRMVEFPLYNLLHYTTYQLATGVGIDSIDATGRITTVFVSLCAALLLYLIVKRISDFKLALLTLIVWTLLPYNIFYSRVVLPDPTMIMLSLLAIYLFIRWLDSKSESPFRWGWYSSAIIAAALALLTKPTAAFLLAVIPAWWWLQRGNRIFKELKFYLFGALTILPLLWWRFLWIPQYPEGIPFSKWLLNGDGIRLKPAWWRWIFYERLGNLILGGIGLVAFSLGVLQRPQISHYQDEQPVYKRDEWIYWFWLAFSILYLIIFATGNVRHDYYQIPIIPIVCIFVARGLQSLWNQNFYITWVAKPAAIMVFGLMLAFSWYQINGYYQINNPIIVEVGQQADQLLPPDAKVIAPYNGDTALLYHINRPGWPYITLNSIEDMRQTLGATHYVSVSRDERTVEAEQQYTVLTGTDVYVIIELTPNPEIDSPN